jgi:hypothetical protein
MFATRPFNRTSGPAGRTEARAAVAAAQPLPQAQAVPLLLPQAVICGA